MFDWPAGHYRDRMETMFEAFLDEYRAALNGCVDDLTEEQVRRSMVPSLRWVYLHVLRELAQHCGHADILREQLMSSETADADGGRRLREIRLPGAYWSLRIPPARGCCVSLQLVRHLDGAA